MTLALFFFKLATWIFFKFLQLGFYKPVNLSSVCLELSWIVIENLILCSIFMTLLTKHTCNYPIFRWTCILWGKQLNVFETKIGWFSIKVVKLKNKTLVSLLSKLTLYFAWEAVISFAYNSIWRELALGMEGIWNSIDYYSKRKSLPIPTWPPPRVDCSCFILFVRVLLCLWFFFHADRVMLDIYASLSDAERKYWAWNQMINKHCWNFTTVYSIEVQHGQYTCPSTLSGWGSDMLMLYFIIGLLILRSSCWWTLPKTL